MKFFKLLLILFLNISVNANARENYCEQLKSLINGNQRNYAALENLQSLCQDQIDNGPNAKVIKALSNLNLNEILQNAHAQRINERSKLIKLIDSVMNVYSGTKEREVLLTRDNAFFTAQLNKLKVARKDLESSTNKTIQFYYDRDTKLKLAPLRNISKSDLSHQALKTLNSFISTEESFELLSKDIINKIDNGLDKAIESSMGIVSGYQTLANFTQSELMKEEFLKDISEEILNLTATTTLGKFLIKSKVSNVLFSIEKKSAMGLVEAASEEAVLLESMISNFLSALPKKLSNKVKQKQEFIKTINQLEQKKVMLSKLSVPQIDQRLNYFISDLITQINKNIQNCLSKNNYFEAQWQSITKDYENIKKTQAKTNEEQKIKILVSQSLVERMSIFKNLCEAGAL